MGDGHEDYGQHLRLNNSINDYIKKMDVYTNTLQVGKSQLPNHTLSQSDWNYIQKTMEDKYVKHTGEPNQKAIDQAQQETYDIMKSIVRKEDVIGVLKVLIDNPVGLTMTGFLDKNRLIHECLQEGYLERRCDQGTHYYVITRDGRLAVDMDAL